MTKIKPVEERITDVDTALRCFKTLYQKHSFEMPDEQLFLEDCAYSLKLLEKLSHFSGLNIITLIPHTTLKIPTQMFTPRNAFGLGENRFVVRRDLLVAEIGDDIILCDTQGDGIKVQKKITGYSHIDERWCEITCT